MHRIKTACCNANLIALILDARLLHHRRIMLRLFFAAIFVIGLRWASNRCHRTHDAIPYRPLTLPSRVAIV